MSAVFRLRPARLIAIGALLVTLATPAAFPAGVAASDGRFHPCVHYQDHWGGSTYYVYRGHHTHSNGEHHHTWDQYYLGYQYLGVAHVTC